MKIFNLSLQIIYMKNTQFFTFFRFVCNLFTLSPFLFIFREQLYQKKGIHIFPL